MMKQQRKRVQCVSNTSSSGYHRDLNPGEWYDAEEWFFSSEIRYYMIYWGNGASDYAVYDRELFVSIEEKRELALQKIGI